MAKYSPQIHTTWRGTSSQQRFRLLTTSRRTVCRETYQGQIRGVLTRQSPSEPSLIALVICTFTLLIVGFLAPAEAGTAVAPSR